MHKGLGGHCPGPTLYTRSKQRSGVASLLLLVRHPIYSGENSVKNYMSVYVLLFHLLLILIRNSMVCKLGGQKLQRYKGVNGNVCPSLWDSGS